MDFLQKYFYRVFELPLHRETPKNVLKKKVRKKSGGLVGSSKANQIYAEVRHFCFECPSDLRSKIYLQVVLGAVGLGAASCKLQAGWAVACCDFAVRWQLAVAEKEKAALVC
jgi:hypothetical protein